MLLVSSFLPKAMGMKWLFSRAESCRASDSLLRRGSRAEVVNLFSRSKRASIVSLTLRTRSVTWEIREGLTSRLVACGMLDFLLER